MNKHHYSVKKFKEIFYISHLNDIKSFTLEQEVDTSVEKFIARKWAD